MRRRENWADGIAVSQFVLDGRADILVCRLGDFPIARRNTGLVNPVNRPAGKPA